MTATAPRGVRMSKAFWEGFRQGYLKTGWYGIIIAAAFVIGLTLGSYSHPYEQCSRMYDTPNDVSECTWIKTNGR